MPGSRRWEESTWSIPSFGRIIAINPFLKNQSKLTYLVEEACKLLILPHFSSLTSLVFVPRYGDIRYLLFSSCLTIHFLKRLLEVQSVHKSSGGMALDTAIFICFSYFTSSATMIDLRSAPYCNPRATGATN
ncbi:hypothetical protein RchiOBHm_Chr6g0262361 [Rosa chinensis]|uniref:Uncharacterized protein n=1 Tax=Rosa chinensis TaxID=74649 RepID=A0A2P6PNM7_ROSCH|nr:hypothetical protein RchiOBHm_Chr6g0262361 [Rosa chinensis]